jgi:hypothetical protein
MRQGTAQVLMGLAEAPHLIKDQGAPVQDATGRSAVRSLHCPVQDRQPFLAPAGPGERDPERGLHVGLPLRLARRAGQAHSPPQLADRFAEVPSVTKDYPDRVVSQRCVICARLARQYRPRSEKGILGPGYGERQELGCIRISRRHSDNARQFSTPFKQENWGGWL